MTEWTPERLLKLQELTDGGVPTKEIADFFDKTPDAIRNARRYNRVDGPFAPNNTPWREENVEQLKALWAEGLSGSVIGERLGISRNAVIGKANRLGLSARAVSSRKNTTRKASAAKLFFKKIRKERRQVHQYGASGPRVFQFVDVACDIAPTIADKPCNLVDLPKNGCRWPCEGDGHQTIFCGGDSIEGLSYCARHCRVAYRPAR